MNITQLLQEDMEFQSELSSYIDSQFEEKISVEIANIKQELDLKIDTFLDAFAEDFIRSHPEVTEDSMKVILADKIIGKFMNL